jgi:hypothetical protein
MLTQRNLNNLILLLLEIEGSGLPFQVRTRNKVQLDTEKLWHTSRVESIPCGNFPSVLSSALHPPFCWVERNNLLVI